MTALFPNAPSDIRFAMLMALTLSLPACGGGADEPTAQPAAAAAVAAAPAQSPTGETLTSAAAPAPAVAGCGLPDIRADALRLVNARRAAGAVCGARGRFAAAPALSWDAALATAADGHSRDMAARDDFSHTGADGRSPAQRATAAGYAWQSVGENIGAGYGSVQAVVDGWMASEGHCANLMTASFVHMGLACATASSGGFDRYWTLVLARPG